VNDRAVTGWHKVNDLAHRGRVRIAGHDQGAWRDPGRVTSLIQPRAGEALTRSESIPPCTRSLRAGGKGFVSRISGFSSRAGHLLTRRAIHAGDLRELKRLSDAGCDEAGHELERLLADPADAGED
jgi:hypothetical protein